MKQENSLPAVLKASLPTIHHTQSTRCFSTLLLFIIHFIDLYCSDLTSLCNFSCFGGTFSDKGSFSWMLLESCLCPLLNRRCRSFNLAKYYCLFTIPCAFSM